jgi:hypothetical protein
MKSTSMMNSLRASSRFQSRFLPCRMVPRALLVTTLVQKPALTPSSWVFR